MSKDVLVKVYDSYDSAAKSVDTLIDGGVLKKYISVIGKGEQKTQDGFEFNKNRENAIFWGEQGAFWGGLWGLLMGGILFWTPGVGPILATGQILTAIAGMTGGAVMFGAAGAMTAWLVDLGIEKSLAVKYGEMIKDDHILVIVHGSEDAVKIAKKALGEA
ncbi:general stress protein [Sulfurimonas sp.]|uniref:general stress protein n=1 Tax=Sulfurimonas sp. TaxID=2022749 RepID=UPI0026113539|nr:general stress protein [Sulfurimonas sp.]